MTSHNIFWSSVLNTLDILEDNRDNQQSFTSFVFVFLPPVLWSRAIIICHYLSLKSPTFCNLWFVVITPFCQSLSNFYYLFMNTNNNSKNKYRINYSYLQRTAGYLTDLIKYTRIWMNEWMDELRLSFLPSSTCINCCCHALSLSLLRQTLSCNGFPLYFFIFHFDFVAFVSLSNVLATK